MNPKIKERFETLPEDVRHAILRLREQPDPREDPREVLELRLFEMRDRISRNAGRSRSGCPDEHRFGLSDATRWRNGKTRKHASRRAYCRIIIEWQNRTRETIDIKYLLQISSSKLIAQQSTDQKFGNTQSSQENIWKFKFTIFRRHI